jgi:hypothetical protein
MEIYFLVSESGVIASAILISTVAAVLLPLLWFLSQRLGNSSFYREAHSATVFLLKTEIFWKKSHYVIESIDYNEYNTNISQNICASSWNDSGDIFL